VLEALGYLIGSVDDSSNLRLIKNILPLRFALSRNSVLTPEGEKAILDVDTDHPPIILAGKATITRETSAEFIAQLAKLSRVRTHFTEATLQQKSGITHWQGSIHDESDAVAYENLHHLEGSLEATQATAVTLPALRSLNYFFLAPRASTVVLPTLQTLRFCFMAGQLKAVNLPAIHWVGGDFFTRRAEHVEMPQIKKLCGCFLAPYAKTVYAPRLAYVGGHFVVNENTQVDAPLLQIHGDLARVSIT
jgi:hypothetical protein